MIAFLVYVAAGLCLGHSRPLAPSDLVSYEPCVALQMCDDPGMPLQLQRNGILLLHHRRGYVNMPILQHGLPVIGHNSQLPPQPVSDPSPLIEDRDDVDNTTATKPADAAMTVASEATPMVSAAGLPLNITGLTQLFNLTKMVQNMANQTQKLRSNLANLWTMYSESVLTGVARHLRPKSYSARAGSKPMQTPPEDGVESDPAKSAHGAYTEADSPASRYGTQQWVLVTDDSDEADLA